MNISEKIATPIVDAAVGIPHPVSELIPKSCRNASGSSPEASLRPLSCQGRAITDNQFEPHQSPPHQRQMQARPAQHPRHTHQSSDCRAIIAGKQFMKSVIYGISLGWIHPPRREPLKRRFLRWLMSWFCDEGEEA